MVFHGFVDSWGNLHTMKKDVTSTQGRMVVVIALQFNGLRVERNEAEDCHDEEELLVLTQDS